MAIITTGSVNRAIDLGPLGVRLFATLTEKNLAKSAVAPLFETVKVKGKYHTTTNFEGDGYLSVRGEAEAFAAGDLHQRGEKTWQMENYGKLFVLSQEAIEDAVAMDILKAASANLAASVAATKDLVLSNVFNNAFTSTYAGFDGKELCATDHPVDAGNFANEEAAGSALSVTAIENMLTAVAKYSAANGLKVNVDPKALLVPADLWITAQKVMKSIKIPGSMDNDANVAPLHFMQNEPIMNRYLSSTTAYFICNDVANGLLHLDRVAPEMSSDNRHENETLAMKVRMRMGTAWGDFRAVHGNVGA